MAQDPVVIPEKIYFKIGEVCELLGVQAHVLRYWETEFSMLSPQKNKSGQRSYRRRDVEIALKIKQLLYNEMFTIAGARKKLLSDSRESNKPKAVTPEVKVEPAVETTSSAPTLFDTGVEVAVPQQQAVQQPAVTFDGDQSEAVRTLAIHLFEIREILKPKPPVDI